MPTDTDTSLPGLGSNLPRLWPTTPSYCRCMPVFLQECEYDGFRSASRGSTSKGPPRFRLLYHRCPPITRARRLTGQEERCVLIDGTVRRTPVARIHISTPYYTGMTKAVCMNNQLFDVIVGNIPGATGFPSSSPYNRKRHYTGRPWFRNFSKKKSQVLRGFC